jgi:WD40 repeat protein
MRRATSLAVVVCIAMSLAPLPARARQTGARARLRHTVAETVAARWSPDNKTLAVATYGKGLVLYDAAEDKARVELKLARQVLGPEALAFTPDGRALVVHTDRVSLYDATDGRLLREFAEKTEPISSYEKYYKPEERETLEKDEFGMNRKETVYPSEGAETEELPMRNPGGRVVSPDGKTLLVRAREEGRAQVYDLSTGALKFTLEPVADTPRRKFVKGFGDAQGEFSPDGRLILTTHRNHTPRLWDAQTGAHVADLAPQPGTVVGARFSHDGKFVATTTFLNNSGVVKIWEAATGKLRHTVGTPKDEHYFAAWNPSDNTFVVKTIRKWEVKIFDAETGALAAQLDGKAVKEKFDRNLTFVYSPDGRVLVTQARQEPSFLFNLGVKKGKPRLLAHLWDARTGAHLLSLRDTQARGAHAYVYDKYFWSPPGDILVTAGVSIKLWSRRGELLQELDGNALLQAGLTADGKLLAFVSGSPSLVNWTVLSDAVSTAKILVGKLPKDNTPRAHVWRLESN